MTCPSDALVEATAEAWAVLDGKGERFANVHTDDVFGGYCADARALLDAMERRGVRVSMADEAKPISWFSWVWLLVAMPLIVLGAVAFVLDVHSPWAGCCLVGFMLWASLGWGRGP